MSRINYLTEFAVVAIVIGLVWFGWRSRLFSLFVREEPEVNAKTQGRKDAKEE